MFKQKLSTFLFRNQFKNILAARQILKSKQQHFQISASTRQSVNTEWEKARPFEEIPTISALKMLRENLPGGKYYKKDTPEVMHLVKQEFGDIFVIPPLLGKPQMVTACNPEDFEHVYRSEGVWPERLILEILHYHRSKHRPDFYKGVNGLLTTQNEKWGKFRSTVNPALIQPKNIRLYLPKMAQVNLEFLERIRKIRHPSTLEMPADFENVINRWTLESVSIVALDKQLGLLRDGEIEPFVKKFFDSLTEFMFLSSELEFKPSLWRYIATPQFKREMAALDYIQEVTSKFIIEAIERLSQEAAKGIEKPDAERSILEKLLKINRNVAIVMAMDMLMAGVDTTSSTFVGALLCLAQFPEKQAKLREEIHRILPHKDSEFTEKSLNDMTYLRACIKESMRLYPLVIGSARVVRTNVVLSGYRIPKDTVVVMNTSDLNRDEKYYSRPNEYLPERWLRSTDEDTANNKCPHALKTNNPFVHLPFGFGPRSCIGRRIAELVLELGVARLVRNFNIAYNYPIEKPFKSLLINVPNIPLKFQFTDVEN